MSTSSDVRNYISVGKHIVQLLRDVITAAHHQAALIVPQVSYPGSSQGPGTSASVAVAPVFMAASCSSPVISTWPVAGFGFRKIMRRPYMNVKAKRSLTAVSLNVKSGVRSYSHDSSVQSMLDCHLTSFSKQLTGRGSLRSCSSAHACPLHQRR